MTEKSFQEDNRKSPKYVPKTYDELSELKNKIAYHQQLHDRLPNGFIRAGVRQILIKFMIEYNNGFGVQVYKPAEL